MHVDHKNYYIILYPRVHDNVQFRDIKFVISFEKPSATCTARRTKYFTHN